MVDIIATLGPASDDILTLRAMMSAGATFARINLSHADLGYVKKMIPLCRQLGFPLIIDTEGAQVRSGMLQSSVIILEQGDIVKLHNSPMVGDKKNIHLWPIGIINRLNQGDMVSIDFDSLLLTVIDTTCIDQGYVKAKVTNGGVTGQNKSVVIQDAHGTKLQLPCLSAKDKEVVTYALQNNVKYVAASFMNSGEDVDAVREFVGAETKIISKIESKIALKNVTEILAKSNYCLIDRGDLSKEISIEKIPLTQKILLRNGQKQNTPIFVATNLLESMNSNKKPTRAEVNDVINTILDGASGLVLAGETASGNYPIECVKMLSTLAKQSGLVNDIDKSIVDDKVIQRLQDLDYLDGDIGGNLIAPHGGRLINRMLKKPLVKEYLESLFKIPISTETYMDAEQIAIGSFSPLEGFMCRKDFYSVVNEMKLISGVTWTIPIVLPITSETKSKIKLRDDVALTYYSQDSGVTPSEEIVAIMNVSDIFEIDKETVAKKIYNTLSNEHPGVRNTLNSSNILLGGKITLVKRRVSKYKQYELTPAQCRKIFEEKGWSRIVGFHTRNVIHKSHEFIQLTALNNECCDGLFVHPVIGKKKIGDYQAEYIISTYEMMINQFYPKEKVVFGTFSTFSRYAGPREAVFTAICRKNYGCSHFIVGRDHTGVKNFYDPLESHEIFSKFSDLMIKPILFNHVYYSPELGDYVHKTNQLGNSQNLDKFDSLVGTKGPTTPGNSNVNYISGTEARKMLEAGIKPPDWYMRPEISKLILDALSKNEEVFVKNK